MVDLLVGSEVNNKRIAHIESCFGRSGTPLALKGRVLVGEGVLTKMCRKGPKPRQFFLFNDIIVYGKILVRKKMYIKQNIIPLEKVVLEDFPDDMNQGDLKYGWLIKTPTRSFAVYAGSETEKDEWIQHIQKCVKSLLKRTGSRPSGEHAAVWVPDTQAKICMHCNVMQFTLLNRRHHCRNCGAVICASCSKSRFLIPSQSSKPVRVCDTCKNKLVTQRLGEVTPTNTMTTPSTGHNSTSTNSSTVVVKTSTRIGTGNRNEKPTSTDLADSVNTSVSSSSSSAQNKIESNPENPKDLESSSDTDEDIDEINQKLNQLLEPYEIEKPTFYNVALNSEELKEDNQINSTLQSKGQQKQGKGTIKSNCNSIDRQANKSNSIDSSKSK
ncbi:pleckstrin homology domain-containing family F member 2-like [Panonychus citri]|uniref:pleckstrin homology domain-containing family F member 2-like n=1 Tax=Panonychus citri TaxID=50023 RepID=UPI0023081CD8|nr:pleckstrin homology domain-containing family F member 2-like [Panonychus citri]